MADLAAYLRVSTDTQAEHGLGLDVQRGGIGSWAVSQGHRIRSWHADAGVNGSNGLDGREALSDALADIRSGRVAGLVIYRLDRLARDLVTQETLLAEIAKQGGRVFSTMAAEQEVIEDDPEDPARRLIRQVLGSVAEYERSLIKLRLRNGRRRKHALGGYAYGGPGYGWKAQDKQLVPDPAEQEVIGRIRGLRQAGASYREIAAVLSAENAPTKRPGSRWDPQTVRRISLRAA